MKYSELNNLSQADLDKRIASEKEALRKLKFSHAISPIEKPDQIRLARRNIARLQTARRAHELGIGTPID